MATDNQIYTKDELLKKLTEKERIFCHQYIIDWNGSRAARDAGYSEEHSRQQAYENLTKQYINQYIEFIKDDVEKECGISKIRQINELAKIAYSSIAHLHDTWIELNDWDIIKQNNPNALAAIESIDTKTETRTLKVDGDVDINIEINYVKIKLYSKLTAISEINKMMGYNAPERHINTNTNIDTTPTKEEAKKISEDLENEC